MLVPQWALYSTATLRQQSQDVTSEFSLRTGERAAFIFGGIRPHGQQPDTEFVEQRFRQTARFGRGWIAQSKYKDRWREMVNRSALMLKMLISREHGSLIAAPTFPCQNKLAEYATGTIVSHGSEMRH